MSLSNIIHSFCGSVRLSAVAESHVFLFLSFYLDFFVQPRLALSLAAVGHTGHISTGRDNLTPKGHMYSFYYNLIVKEVTQGQ